MESVMQYLVQPSHLIELAIAAFLLFGTIGFLDRRSGSGRR